MRAGIVGWDPVSVYWQPSFLVRMYVLFLFVVTAIIVYRSISLAIELWRLRKFGRADKWGSRETQKALQYCEFGVHSLKRWSAFTLRASVFVALVGFADVFRVLASQEITAGIGFLRGKTAETCVQLALGMFVVLLADATRGYFESALEKRPMKWEGSAT